MTRIIREGAGMVRTLILLCLLCGTALSQPAQRVKILALPVQLTGDYRPIDAARFGRLLEEKVEKLAPDVDLVPVDPKDPRLSGVDLSFSLEPDQAAGLARAFQTDLVSYVSVGFEKESRLVGNAGDPSANPAGMTMSQPYRYVVTVMGLARVQIVGADSRVLLEGPLGLFCSDATQHPDDGEGFGGLEERLASSCVDDLATRVVDVSRNWVNRSQAR
ncbi:MAG: hypothetical protein AB1758_16080 [Candidatus Eremiobacterota bacterium]